jgi:putative PEP-CTERM system histidine kinase
MLSDPVGASSHMLAALLFAVLAAWQSDRWRDRAARAVIAGCATTAIWAATTATIGVDAAGSQVAESLRNFAWLSFLYAMLRRGGTRYQMLDTLYTALAFVVAATGVIDLLMVLGPLHDARPPAYLVSSFTLRMIFAIGALVAVHNLYTATTSGARAGVSMALAALGIMWAVDLTYYALCWSRSKWLVDLSAVRGLVAIGLVPLLALAARRNTDWTIRLSRTFAFRTIGLVGTVIYLGFVLAAANAIESVGSPLARAIPPLTVLAAAIIVVVAMISPRARAWTSVMLSKHLFAHRYDYRAEWLRFTDTLGIPGPGAPGLDARVVKAVADIVQAPGGLLLLPASDGLALGARWQWPTLSPAHEPGGGELARVLAGGRIVELDPLRREGGDPAEAATVPEWILADPAAWAIVPLVHFNRLVGAVLLERPLVPRSFDWEDFDLLRLAGRQVASYLAEAGAQEALNDAARFDEFNRRFAFIMHDIKNLVSQLTLVTRNAERHADKPEFRADMIATLQSSTARMNDLLARLSQHNTGRVEEPRPVELGRVAASVAAAQRKRHRVVVAGEPGIFALADPQRLEQALSHLVHNAIDASPPNEPVILTTIRRGRETGIEVADRGAGMTPDFVRGALFRPFTSTKTGGFGVGAYEARSLITAMGGRIGISTNIGEGTRMTIWLPDTASEELPRAATRNAA